MRTGQKIKNILTILVILTGLIFSYPVISATITEILGTDSIKDSRGVINTNFSNLNTDKLEESDLSSLTPGSINYQALNWYWATTSQAYWENQQWRWATSSSDYWLTQQTTDNLTEGSNLYYTDNRVINYLNSSSTIFTEADNLSYWTDNYTSYFNDALNSTTTLDLDTLGINTSITVPVDSFGTDEIEDVYLLNTGDTATGNYNFDSGTLYVDASNNRVGIGLASPQFQLDVISGAINVGLHIESTDALGGFSLEDNATTDANQVTVFARGNNMELYSGGSLAMKLESDQDIAMDTDTLFVDATDNFVGVGTSAPSGNLHINASSTNYALKVFNTNIEADSYTGRGLYSLTEYTANTTTDVFPFENYFRLNFEINDANTADTPILQMNEVRVDGGAGVATTGHPVGIKSMVSNYVEGTLTKAIGLEGAINSASAAGSLLDAQSVQAQLQGTNYGTMNYYGFYSNSNTGINEGTMPIFADYYSPNNSSSLNAGAGIIEHLYSFRNADASKVISTAGNMAIGTTTPGANLDVINTIRMTSSANISNIIANQTVGSLEFYYNDDSASAPIVGAKIVASSPTSWSTTGTNYNSDLRFYTTSDLGVAATEKMRINEDGNVGIGTSGPNARLSFGNGVEEKIRLYDTGVVGTSYGFGINSSDLQIFAANSADITFRDNGYGGTENMRIDGVTGAIGIATSTPGGTYGEKLTVVGNAFFDTSAGDFLIQNSGGGSVELNSSGSLNYEVVSGGVHTWSDGGVENMRLTGTGYLGVATTTPWAQLSVEGQGTNPALVVSDTSNNTDLIVDASGQVGIGTASPARNFHIQGTDLAYLHISNTDAGTGTGNGFDMGIDTAENILFYNRENTDMYFGNNSSEKMRIKATGDVGIGTASPGRKLEVADATAAVIKVNTTGSGDSGFDFVGNSKTWQYRMRGASDRFDIYSSTLGDNVMSLLSTGSVGIGTASPVTKLHVASTTEDTYITVQTGKTNGNAGFKFQNNAVTWTFYNNTNDDFVTYDGAYSPLVIKNGAGNERITIETNGDINFDDNNIYFHNANNALGIATTTPGGTYGEKLTVVGDSYITGNLYLDGDSKLYQSGLPLLVASSTLGNISLGYDVSPNLNSDSSSNVYIGSKAGYLATSTDFNVGIGYFSLYNSTNNSDTYSGSYNTAMGWASLYNNTEGKFNLGLGAGALLNNTTGDYNSSVGGYSLYTNTTGSYNTAFGQYALRYNNTGSNNMALGYEAGENSTGNNNIFIGYRTGDTITAGNNNLAIGHDIDLPNSTGSNQLDIGNLIFGNGIDGTGTSISSGSIGIATTTPGGTYSERLTVAGNTYITGKLYVDGGVDPPYVSFTDENCETIKQRYIDEEVKDNIMLFWNSDNMQFEYYLAEENNCYAISSNVPEEKTDDKKWYLFGLLGLLGLLPKIKK